MRKNKKEYTPSPAEIAAGCLEVQATWSDAEFYKRAGITPPIWAQWDSKLPDWTAPEVRSVASLIQMKGLSS